MGTPLSTCQTLGTLRLAGFSLVFIISVPAALLSVQLTICLTSSFTHYQFTPAWSRALLKFTLVQSWNSKSFFMCQLPSGLQALQNSWREDRSVNIKKTKQNRGLLTCTMCASGSVLTGEVMRKEKMKISSQNAIHWKIVSCCWQENKTINEGIEIVGTLQRQ